jgi:hypothetical protein
MDEDDEAISVAGIASHGLRLPPSLFELWGTSVMTKLDAKLWTLDVRFDISLNFELVFTVER